MPANKPSVTAVITTMLLSLFRQMFLQETDVIIAFWYLLAAQGLDRFKQEYAHHRIGEGDQRDESHDEGLVAV